MSYAKEIDGLDVSIGWLLPALLIPCAAAYRLAKFNIDDEQEYGFKGLPTPSVGLFVASIPLIYWYGHYDWAINLLLNKWFLYALILILSFLMISDLPIMSLKFADYGMKNNIPKILLLVLSIVLVLLFKWMAVPFIFLAYIILSLATEKRRTKKINT
jgi:CDP-diacylglycerol--serine O-phosphatidyltransferase